MKLHDLKPPKGSKKDRKRVARGGKLGKTSTRGANGQNSRSGGGVSPGFEGGQTPWYKRLPKFRGFNNVFKEVYQVVNLGDLEALEGISEVTIEVLAANGLIRKSTAPVKILADGNLTKALTVRANAFSKSAKESIEAAGGKAEVI